MKDDLIYLDVVFDRTNATYSINENITGYIYVKNIKNKLENISFVYSASGKLIVQNAHRQQSIEKIQSTALHQLSLFGLNYSVTHDKYISQENNKFKFSFELVPTESEQLIESYVGVYISCEYIMKVDLLTTYDKRFKFNAPFFVQVKGQGQQILKSLTYPQPHEFILDKNSLNMTRKTKDTLIPCFKIQVFIDSKVCQVNDDLEGYFIVDECESNIKSIDLQLIRIEQIIGKQDQVREQTEIQWIQIAEGNPVKHLEIPFQMIYPKHFTCPNFKYKSMQVDFEVSFIVILQDGFKISQNFPINLFR